MTLSRTTFSIMTLSIMTLSIKPYFATPSIKDTKHNNLPLSCLSRFIHCYAECRGAPFCGLYCKSFMIVIYDHNDSTIVIYDCNDSGMYYKTTIVTRYELKLCSKLKHNLQSYNRNLQY